MLNFDTAKIDYSTSKFSDMKKNMGTADKIIRLVIAAIIVTLFVTNILTGTLGIVLLVVSVIFVLTSFVSFCPLYAVVGINSCSYKPNE